MIMISSTCRVATCRDCRRDVANECLMLKYVPQGCSRDKSRPYKWMEATSVYENQMHRTFGLNQKKQPAGAAFLRKDRESLLRRALRGNEPSRVLIPPFPCKKSSLQGLLFCGKTGIRTLGTRKGTTVFETVPIDHSGIFPRVLHRKGTKVFRHGEIFSAVSVTECFFLTICTAIPA